MKKLIFGVVALLIVAGALVTFSTVSAKNIEFQASATPQPDSTDPDATGPAWMMRGGRGPMMGWRGEHGFGPMMGMRGDEEFGPMHEEMIAALAEKLGLTEAELTERLEAGDTPLQIAEEKGYSQDEFFTLMQEARDLALDKAVANGDLTQEQADLMKEHRAGKMGHRAGHMRGQHEGCPNLSGEDSATPSE